MIGGQGTVREIKLPFSSLNDDNEIRRDILFPYLAEPYDRVLKFYDDA